MNTHGNKADKIERVEEVIRLLNNADDFNIDVINHRFEIPKTDVDYPSNIQQMTGRTTIKIEVLDIDKYQECFDEMIKSMNLHAKLNNERDVSIEELKSKLIDELTRGDNN